MKEHSERELKGCGMLLPENGQALGNRPCNGNILHKLVEETQATMLTLEAMTPNTAKSVETAL